MLPFELAACPPEYAACGNCSFVIPDCRLAGSYTGLAGNSPIVGNTDDAHSTGVSSSTRPVGNPSMLAVFLVRRYSRSPFSPFAAAQRASVSRSAT